MLEYLHLKNVGPSPDLQMELAPRLNVITGDNGVGKSLTVEVEGAPMVVCNGLIRDWAVWIREKGRLAELMSSVVRRHLHPRWQRSILPSLLHVAEALYEPGL